MSGDIEPKKQEENSDLTVDLRGGIITFWCGVAFREESGYLYANFQVRQPDDTRVLLGNADVRFSLSQYFKDENDVQRFKDELMLEIAASPQIVAGAIPQAFGDLCFSTLKRLGKRVNARSYQKARAGALNELFGQRYGVTERGPAQSWERSALASALKEIMTAANFHQRHDFEYLAEQLRERHSTDVPKNGEALKKQLKRKNLLKWYEGLAAGQV